MVGEEKEFSAATFLEVESTKRVWEIFLANLMAMYVRCPNTVGLDQGRQL